MEVCKPWEFPVMDKPTSAYEKLPVAPHGPKEAYIKGLIDMVNLMRATYPVGSRVERDPMQLLEDKLKYIEMLD